MSGYVVHPSRSLPGLATSGAATNSGPNLIRVNPTQDVFVDADVTYHPMVKTRNRNLNAVVTDGLIRSHFGYHHNNVEINRSLTAFVSHQSLPISPIQDLSVYLQGLVYPLLQPVRSNSLTDRIRLYFQTPNQSKIFATTRPDISNSEFFIEELYQINPQNYAYVSLYFPANNHSYLLPTILVAYMLKKNRQSHFVPSGTRAKVICLVTPDVDVSVRTLLREFYDEVIEAPYITWDRDKKQAIHISDVSDGHLKSNHVYSYVFTKLHIFNAELFPYQKVVFLDVDVLPMGYFDSLFSLDTPAGWLEHRRAQRMENGVASWASDRGNMVRHGEAIPRNLTDLSNIYASDINASLLVVKPNNGEFNDMLGLLKSPTKFWLGWNRFYRGCWMGNYFCPYYLLPEQNFLTQYYSGRWHSVDLGFTSWSLELFHSFGMTFAGFTVKPWKIQSAGQLYTVNPYSVFSRINNQETNRSDGVRLFNHELAKLILEIPDSTMSHLAPILREWPLQLSQRAFDPWEPEVDLFSANCLVPWWTAAVTPGTQERLSLDQKLLLLVLNRRVGWCQTENLQQSMDSHWFVTQLGPHIYDLKMKATIYYLLDCFWHILENNHCLSDCFLANQTWTAYQQFQDLDLTADHVELTVVHRLCSFEQMFLSIVSQVLEHDFLQVYIYGFWPAKLSSSLHLDPHQHQHPHPRPQPQYIQVILSHQINRPLYCYSHHAVYLTYDQLVSHFQQIKPQYLNVSISYPFYLKIKDRLSMTNQEVIVMKDEHYPKLPWIDVFLAPPGPQFPLTTHRCDYYYLKSSSPFDGWVKMPIINRPFRWPHLNQSKTKSNGEQEQLDLYHLGPQRTVNFKLHPHYRDIIANLHQFYYDTFNQNYWQLTLLHPFPGGNKSAVL